MRDLLHPLLLALTLIDLVFVGVTEVVPTSGLMPLLLLATVSPWLRRLQRFTIYRAIWNTGVLVVFAMLVRHASTTGLLHMLEDGLLLAVLCQVHLLNNIGARQRPDLVFFNSFLIAFVTSFFAASVSWSVLFVIHALVFVPALQLNVLARREGGVDWPIARTMLRDSLPRTAAIGAATALVFAFWPRDFHHEGWLNQALTQHEGLESGLAEMIRLDDERPVRLGNEVVMRIADTSATPFDIPTHWRGVTYSMFDGRSWQRRDDLHADLPWEREGDGSWQRPMRAMPATLRVQLLDARVGHLPLPPNACALRPRSAAGLVLDPKKNGTFTCWRIADAPSAPIEYTVQRSISASQQSVNARTRRLYLQMPRRSVVRTAGHLAEQVRQELPPDASHRTIAQHAADWLRDNRRYQLPGGQGFAGSIAAFAIGSGAGHCEYFATVLALMLRQQGVPCRLVGGYLAQELDENGTTIVRGRHAHAWVEALLPDGSWLTLDATPASDMTVTDDGGTGWWHSIVSELEASWSSVVGFDEAGRARLLSNIAALPSDLLRFALANPLGTLGLLALPFALLYARRRQRRMPVAVVSLIAAARAAGLEQQVGETPREMLVRARGADATDEQCAALAAAVGQHERVRYGGADERSRER